MGATVSSSRPYWVLSVVSYAQHHLRVVYEILVDGKAVLGLAKLHPVRLMVDGAVTLLQKDNVADNIRASIGT